MIKKKEWIAVDAGSLMQLIAPVVTLIRSILVQCVYNPKQVALLLIYTHLRQYAVVADCLKITCLWLESMFCPL